MSFLEFSGFASTSHRRGTPSTPERPFPEGFRRVGRDARSCADLCGRLSTARRTVWQGQSTVARAALYLALGALAAPGIAKGDPIGDRIAEELCYPPSAERLSILPEERKRLLSSPPITGDYRDIQGSDARAWFTVRADGTAVCRTPATTDLSLFFCAPVTLGPRALIRGPARLCDR